MGIGLGHLSFDLLPCVRISVKQRGLLGYHPEPNRETNLELDTKYGRKFFNAETFGCFLLISQ